MNIQIPHNNFVWTSSEGGKKHLKSWLQIEAAIHNRTNDLVISIAVSGISQG